MILLKIWRYIWRFYPYPPLDDWTVEKILRTRDLFYGTILYDPLPCQSKVMVTFYEHRRLFGPPTINFGEITTEEWQRRGGLRMQGFVIERLRSPESRATSKLRLAGQSDKFCVSAAIYDPPAKLYERS